MPNKLGYYIVRSANNIPRGEINGTVKSRTLVISRIFLVAAELADS